MCGENFHVKPIAIVRIGSPPRVRGKLPVYFNQLIFIRITPACAGKTVADTPKASAREDHPRVCGENFHVKPIAIVRIGSPPRVRGKPYNRIVKNKGVRITPACAGKTALLNSKVPCS